MRGKVFRINLPTYLFRKGLTTQFFFRRSKVELSLRMNICSEICWSGLSAVVPPVLGGLHDFFELFRTRSGAIAGGQAGNNVVHHRKDYVDLFFHISSNWCVVIVVASAGFSLVQYTIINRPPINIENIKVFLFILNLTVELFLLSYMCLVFLC